MTHFSRLKIRDAKQVVDADSNFPVFHVNDSHALIQSAGYLKHVYGATENIYFRGQSKLYTCLSPSLFRGIQTQRARDARIFDLQAVRREYVHKAPIFNTFKDIFHEPLLQHYGLKTTWIDLVDNVWIALWFACHHALSDKKSEGYIHFEKRNPNKDISKYVYVLMIGADNKPSKIPGYFSGTSTEFVDLRVGCPSIFLRPHVQHGVLFRAKGESDRRPFDYMASLRGVIRADLQDALMWLGNGSLLNVHALMPPPYYDYGYRILLDLDLQLSKRIGAIQHVGA